MTHEDLDHWFADHRPDERQAEAMQHLRTEARRFAGAILNCTPSCADQTAAVRKVREAVQTAIAAIACGGK